MGRKISNRGRVKQVCGNVVLNRLPGLPASLREMLINGRQGKRPKPDLLQLKQWAEDLQKYAAELGLYADVASKHDYLRVNFFIDEADAPPAIHVRGPRQLELLGEALEACSATGSYRQPRRLNRAQHKSSPALESPARLSMSLL